jgi:hypothetical protein
MAQRLSRGARQRLDIDAGMVPEALVLIGDQHRQIARVHRIGRNRHAPAPVIDGIGPQQRPVAGPHLDRGGARQRRQVGGIDPPVEAIAPQRRQKQPNCKT